MLNSISRLRKNPPTQKMIMPTTVANTNLIKSFMTTFVLLRRADTLLSAHDEYSFLAFGGEGRSVLQRYKKTTLAPIRGQHFAAALSSGVRALVRGILPAALLCPYLSPVAAVLSQGRAKKLGRQSRSAPQARLCSLAATCPLPGRGRRYAPRQAQVCPSAGERVPPEGLLCCLWRPFRRKNAGKARFRARAFGKCIFKSYLYTNKTPIA